MEKNHKKRKKVIIGIILALPVVLLGWIIYMTYFTTYPLGDKLEYIGKSYVGYLPFSDSNFGASYYYATDLSSQEVIEYFNKAKIDNPEDSPKDNDQREYQTFSLVAPDNRYIFIQYHANGPEYTKGFFGLRQTNKQHVVVITDKDYQKAKDSLY
jgi:hypothetical protein